MAIVAWQPGPNRVALVPTQVYCDSTTLGVERRFSLCMLVSIHADNYSGDARDENEIRLSSP